ESHKQLFCSGGKAVFCAIFLYLEEAKNTNKNLSLTFDVSRLITCTISSGWCKNSTLLFSLAQCIVLGGKHFKILFSKGFDNESTALPKNGLEFNDGGKYRPSLRLLEPAVCYRTRKR
ncbi:MAG: hypothetical protein ACLRMI_09345, partial [Streptococcus sp.]